MGLFTTTYRVEKKEGIIFDSWNPVITNLSQKEAEKYIKEKTSGLFSDKESDYRIVKE
ncbi:MULTISPECIES: hypothetical protein [Enterococcus]|uniref:hypothetical protein n=1 Tax=Enterococcus TaxID=1350 RepID=UPI001432BC7D|nr:hypothetical protein [Enterococcus casseliflavus]NKD30909.1 hypothetical protein [Enterococcus casseliflavus]